MVACRCRAVLQDWLWTQFLGLNYTLQNAGVSIYTYICAYACGAIFSHPYI
jgi:hypothetical protein